MEDPYPQTKPPRRMAGEWARVLPLTLLLIAVRTTTGIAGDWSVQLDVSDGAVSHARFIGADSAATDGHDEGIDIPLPPPSPDFSAHLAGPPPFLYYATDIRSADNPIQSWDLVVGEAGLFSVSWDSTAVPECVDLTIDGEDMKTRSTMSFFGDRTIVVQADPAPDPCPAAVLVRQAFSSVAARVTGSGLTLSSTLGEPGFVGAVSNPSWYLQQGFWSGVWRAIATDAPPTVDQSVELANGLRTPYPNPFRERVWVRFAVRQRDHVSLTVYDVAGRRVRTLADREMTEGVHEAVWDGRDQNGAATTTGVYFLKLQIGPWNGSKKVLKLR